LARTSDKLEWLQDPSKINGDNLNCRRCKPTGISGIKSRNIQMPEVKSLKRTMRTRTLEICTEEYMNFR
jgi:hypothetical protein